MAHEERSDFFSYAATLGSIRLTQRETCDLEMLSIGAFSPLRGFMSERDYCSVLDRMRLADGTIFPIPITLSVNDLTGVRIGCDIALRGQKNELLAVMRVGEIFEWNKKRFAEAVAETTSPRHPLVSEMHGWGRFNLSGELRVLGLPERHDFQELRLTPGQTRKHLGALGRSDVVAFQTRNPLHRAHEMMTQRALEMIKGTLLLHPAVGMTKDGDIDNFTRVRAYRASMQLSYARDRVLLSLLPLAMRMAGPREAVWHAIIRRNYGANHFIVGRDHASPGTDGNGKSFYEPLAAQKLVQQMAPEIGIKALAFDEFVYLPDERRYEEISKVIPGRKTVALSGTRIRENFLNAGEELPEWFMRKEVARILSESYPPRHRQGVCLWFTGLSGSGKSTTAELVASLLLEEGRQTSLLDGDVVRNYLSQGLGFSKKDRDINVNRIGFVASEVVRHGGIAVCAAISPYLHARNRVRSMFGEGHFVEIFVDTPLEVCERRDPKGMYAKARRGQIKDFTGIDDVYEAPVSPEITIHTVHSSAPENARYIVEYLRSKGFVTDRRAMAAGA